MPVLKNARHELFAQQLARGVSISAAWREAGFTSDRAVGSKLHTTNADLRARVDELKQAGARRAEVTIESLIREAEEVRTEAMADGQYGAAIAAIREKGVLAGLRVEARDVRIKQTPAEMSDAEIIAILSKGLARVAEANDGLGDGPVEAPPVPSKLN